MAQDVFGNGISVLDAASEPAVNDFVEGFASCETRVVNILAAAERDDSVIVQAYAAALHMFVESPAGPINARPYLQRALQSKAPATARERQLARAVAAWADSDIGAAIGLHQALSASDPRDLVSVKLGQYHCFNRGDFAGMLRLALPALAASPDLPYVHGMAAFAYEQTHQLRQAEHSARRAIRIKRKEPWAHHALAHVLLTEGRYEEGLSFLDEVRDTWVDLNSFMYTHNWWHLCLFDIELGRFDEVLQHYDRHIWGICKDYSQDQIGAVSLLARLELAGVSVGDRWADLGGYLAARLEDHVLPFLDMQYLYGLARAGRPEADRLMNGIEVHAQRAPADAREAWRSVCVPASRGLLAHARGDYRHAAAQLGIARPRLVEIGGSHAQRDLFERIYADSLNR